VFFFCIDYFDKLYFYNDMFIVTKRLLDCLGEINLVLALFYRPECSLMYLDHSHRKCKQEGRCFYVFGTGRPR